MPVWHKATKDLVRDGKLVVVGVAEEQHPDRCRLFLQWHRIGWPMMWDPITKLGLKTVPIVTAIDEHGIVRLTNPDPATIEREFVDRSFPPPAQVASAPRASSKGAPHRGVRLAPNRGALLARAKAEGGASAWKEYGDASLLWGGPRGLAAATDAYAHAVAADPADGFSHFRLGVAYRMRYDSAARQEGDFQAALDQWSRALALDPNQYIWRRRIQQYGPRLDKPYPFYDWVQEARAAVRARGETPVALTAEPTGAEIAAPLRLLKPSGPVAEPDSQGRITRDPGEFIQVETVAIPRQVGAGEPVRLHLVLRPVKGRKAHWNNEAEPPRIWLRLPAGWQAEQQLLELPQPSSATSEEVREVSTELRLPADVSSGPIDLHGYALYNVCESAAGTCLFRRQDLHIRFQVGPLIRSK